MTGLESLVAARGLALVRFAYLLCGDGQHAEDLVQTALERTLKRWRGGGGGDRPEADVRQVIVREYVSSQRLRAASELVVDELPDHAVSDTNPIEHRDAIWPQLAALPGRSGPYSCCSTTRISTITPSPAYSDAPVEPSAARVAAHSRRCGLTQGSWKE